MKRTLSSRNFLISCFFLFLATSFVVTYSYTTSPLFPIRNLDSEIFQYMGYIILHGKIPYTDYFDHKGLFLYFFNALGLLISKQWGVLLLQILYLTIVLVVWYKGIVVIKNQLLRIAIIPIALLCLHNYYNGGNLTEDWSLLFISFPIMRYIRNTELNRTHFTSLELLQIGICLGIITNIRINNIAPLFGLFVICAYDAIKRHEISYLLHSIYIIILGWLIPVFICTIYMYAVGGVRGVYDMIFANLVFNMDYNKTFPAPPLNMEYVKYIYKILLPIPFLLIAGYKKKNLSLLIGIGYIVTLLTLGGKHYAHYYMVFIPLMVYSIGIVKEKIRFLFIICILGLNLKTFYDQFSWNYYFKSYENSAAKFGKLIENIPIEDRDKIWSYNGACLLKEYIGNDIIQCNRMFLAWHSDISKELKQTEYNKITKEHPKYVIYAYYSEKWMNRVANYGGKAIDEDFIKKNYAVISSVSFQDGVKVDCYKLNNK